MDQSKAVPYYDIGLAPLCTVYWRRLKAEHKTSFRHAQTFICGFLAGTVAKSAVAPLARVTILAQTQARAEGTGIASLIATVVRRDGFLGLFRGNSANVVKGGMRNGSVFFLNEGFKPVIRPYADRGPWSEQEAKRVCKFLAGGISGTVATVCLYPIDLIRTQQAIVKGKDSVSFFAVAGRTVGSNGLPGLWSGAGTAMAKTFPSSAIRFGVADLAGDWVRAIGFKAVWLVNLAAGCVGAISATIGMYPAALIIRKIQAESGYPSDKQQYKGSPFRVLRSVLQHEGVPGLYRGLLPEMLKVVPLRSIEFGVTMALLTHLGFLTNG